MVSSKVVGRGVLFDKSKLTNSKTFLQGSVRLSETSEVQLKVFKKTSKFGKPYWGVGAEINSTKLDKPINGRGFFNKNFKEGNWELQLKFMCEDEKEEELLITAYEEKGLNGLSDYFKLKIKSKKN